jgi:hypothetical protein
MSQHLIDTKPKPAKCTRCGNMVITCMVGGTRVAADLTHAPPGHTGTLYDPIKTDGRLHRLKAVTGAAAATWKPGRLHDHNCGASPVDAKEIEPPDTGPHKPSATSGDEPDGTPHPAAPASQTAPHSSPATPATNPPSRLIAICHYCGLAIYRHQRHMADNPNWAYHIDPADCDKTAANTLGGNGKHRDWDALHNMHWKNMQRPIEEINLPEYEEQWHT